jgi:hypothetical protein
MSNHTIPVQFDTDELAPSASVKSSLLFTMRPVYEDVVKAKRIEPPKEPKNPGEYQEVRTSDTVTSIAKAICMNPVDIDCVLEAIAGTDNAMVLESFKKCMILAKLTLDLSLTPTAQNVAHNKDMHQRRIDRYELEKQDVEKAKRERERLIESAQRDYEQQWIRVVEEAETVVNKLPKSAETIAQYAVVEALQKQDPKLIIETDSGITLDHKRIRTLGSENIVNVVDIAHQIITRDTYNFSNLHWDSLDISDLEHALYETKHYMQALLILERLLARHGLEDCPIFVNYDKNIIDLDLDEDKDYDIPGVVDQYLYFIQHRFIDQERYFNHLQD